MKAFRRRAAPFAPRASAWRITRPIRAGGQWAALRLQWRRNARLQAQAGAAGDRPAPPLSWLTSIHLHFNGLRERSLLLASRALSLPNAVVGAPLKLVGVSADAPRRFPALPVNVPGLPARVSHTPSLLAWRIIRVAAMPGAGLQSLQRIGGSDATPISATPYLHPMTISRRASPPQLAWRTSPTPQHRRAPLQSAASTLARGTAPALASDAVSWQSATPALVWRKTGAARHAAGGATPLASPPMLFADPAEPQQPAHAPATPTAAAAIASARRQLQSIAPDPALADRLADEVIRRVERSMRIERERRGH